MKNEKSIKEMLKDIGLYEKVKKILKIIIESENNEFSVEYYDKKEKNFYRKVNGNDVRKGALLLYYFIENNYDEIKAMKYKYKNDYLKNIYILIDFNNKKCCENLGYRLKEKLFINKNNIDKARSYSILVCILNNIIHNDLL